MYSYVNIIIKGKNHTQFFSSLIIQTNLDVSKVYVLLMDNLSKLSFT